jgi:hypothetical protein
MNLRTIFTTIALSLSVSVPSVAQAAWQPLVLLFSTRATHFLGIDYQTENPEKLRAFFYDGPSGGFRAEAKFISGNAQGAFEIEISGRDAVLHFDPTSRKNQTLHSVRGTWVDEYHAKNYAHTPDGRAVYEEMEKMVLQRPRSFVKSDDLLEFGFKDAQGKVFLKSTPTYADHDPFFWGDPNSGALDHQIVARHSSSAGSGGYQRIEIKLHIPTPEDPNQTLNLNQRGNQLEFTLDHKKYAGLTALSEDELEALEVKIRAGTLKLNGATHLQIPEALAGALDGSEVFYLAKDLVDYRPKLYSKTPFKTSEITLSKDAAHRVQIGAADRAATEYSHVIELPDGRYLRFPGRYAKASPSVFRLKPGVTLADLREGDLTDLTVTDLTVLKSVKPSETYLAAFGFDPATYQIPFNLPLRTPCELLLL